MVRFGASQSVTPPFDVRLGLSDVAGGAMCIFIASITAFAAMPLFGEVTSALVFVLGVTLAGALFGLAAGLLAALVAFLLYNFFLMEPVLTLRLATGREVAPLIVFNLCALVAGFLAGQLKDRAMAVRRSNISLSNLLNASEALQSTVRLHDVGQVIDRLGPDTLGVVLHVFALRDARLIPLGANVTSAPISAAAMAAMRQPNSDYGPEGLAVRKLMGSEALVGAIVYEDAPGEQFDSPFMTAFCNLVALAIERAALFEMVSENRAAARAEELKTALLSSVSHDFRTPLTAISASASSLIDYRDQLDAETSRKLLRGIVDECERLNRFTANLLVMSRLEAKQPNMSGQILGVADMLSAVIQRSRANAGQRTISRAHIDADVSVVADAGLFELALLNVLDNAILYSADGSTICIEAKRHSDQCRITVADEGRGIPTEDLTKVFDRFYRVKRSESSPKGSGLGLAIAKGFVEALGGTIEARTPGLGARGTAIIICLPLANLGRRS